MIRKRSRPIRPTSLRLDKQFRVDLFAELGITNNPKRDLLFEKAWDMGHASGYEEVANYALDLVELIE